jgi:hypothetical protein
MYWKRIQILSQFVKPTSDTLLRYFNMFHLAPSPSSLQFIQFTHLFCSEGGSFMTFSEVLSEMISSLHVTLGALLLSSPGPALAVPLLHCTSQLLSVSPYHRLKPGLLTSLFSAVQPYILHKGQLRRLFQVGFATRKKNCEVDLFPFDENSDFINLKTFIIMALVCI